jgi:peptide deformylase
METLSIASIENIPKEVVDCPADNLLRVYKTCLQMSILCIKEQGIGLSAVQVGIPWRLFIVRYMDGGKDKFRFFLNSKYTAITDEKVKSLEGCLSLRNTQGDFRHFQVDRYSNVKVECQELLTEPNLRLEAVSLEPKDFYCNVFQHEIDHQNLVLISDIGVEFEVWK